MFIDKSHIDIKTFYHIYFVPVSENYAQLIKNTMYIRTSPFKITWYMEKLTKVLDKFY